MCTVFAFSFFFKLPVISTRSNSNNIVSKKGAEITVVMDKFKDVYVYSLHVYNVIKDICVN